MADSVSQISKNTEKSKFVSPICRTTSETLRLSEADKSAVQPSSLNVTSTNPKKKTSFQITSVTVGSRMSNDGGDDSADDLDESHTEDVSEMNDISRATDLERETPSYSEDTFSKEDVFFNASASLASAPVIPTSSQYGLAILDSTEAGEAVHPSDMSSNLPDSDLAVVTEKVINLVSSKHDNEVRDSHTHTTRSERFKVVKIESTEPFKRGRWVCMDYLDHTISDNPQSSSSSKVENTESPNQPSGAESTASTVVENPNVINTPVPPSHEESHVVEPVSQVIEGQTVSSQLPAGGNASATTAYTSSPGQTMQVNAQAFSTPQQGQSLSQVPVQHTVPSATQHQSLQPQQIQQVLARANLILIPLQDQQQIQQQQQQQQSAPQQPTQQQLQQLQFQQQQLQALQQQQLQQQAAMQQQLAAQQLAHASMSQFGQAPVVSGFAPTVVPPQYYPPAQHFAPAQPVLSPYPGPPAYQPALLDAIVPPEGADALLQSLAAASTEEQASGEDSESLRGLARALGTVDPPQPSTPLPASSSSASGASAVAIDNKIEQAMDLVKSHLMFAVREEVEVLKEKISELMERISQLETENGILRAAASQETLSQLPQPPQHHPNPNS